MIGRLGWTRIPGADTLTTLLNKRFLEIESFFKGLQRESEDTAGFEFEYRTSFAEGAAFTDGDTTPSVAGGNLFRTANTTGATTITDFDDPHEGQLLIVIAGDGNTTVQDGAGALELQGGGNYVMGVRDTLTLIYDNGYWHEIARSNN